MKINQAELHFILNVPEEEGNRLAQVFGTMENLAGTPVSTLQCLKDTRVSANLISAYARAKVRGAQRGSPIPTIRELVGGLEWSSEFASRLVKIFSTLRNLLETSPDDLQSLMDCDSNRVELIRAYARLKIRGDHGTPLDEPRVLCGRLRLAPKYAERLFRLFSTWENLAATSPDDLIVLAGQTQLAARILAYARLRLLPEGLTVLTEDALLADLGVSPRFANRLVELFKTMENLAATNPCDLQALVGCDMEAAKIIVAYAWVMVGPRAQE